MQLMDWFGNPIAVGGKPEAQKDANPCVALYGPCAIEGQTCKGCIHLRYPIMPNPKARFWKCALRKLTHGRATDHKVGYPACAKYEERTEEYHGG